MQATQGLRTLYGEQGSWRSAHQASLVAHVLEGVRDVLAVLPTGVGKSLSFLIPAFVQEKVLIVVFPLVALKHDMERRLSNARAPYATWSRQLLPASAPTLVLTSIESAMTQQYCNFVRTLHAMGRLLCVVLDEAHLVFQDFRSSMHLASAIRPASVPMVALTGTMPPACVGHLETRLGAQFTILRGSTVRPELK